MLPKGNFGIKGLNNKQTHVIVHWPLHLLPFLLAQQSRTNSVVSTSLSSRGQGFIHLVSSDSESESSIVLCKGRKRRLSEDEEEGSRSSTPLTTKMVKKIEKTEDDAVPLPDPFPLPRHYRADVEVALKTGKMTSETRSAFISAVASAMLRYKLYPTRDDYICVARTAIGKYLFLRSPTGTNTSCTLVK